GFVTAWPAGLPRPLASTLNFEPGDNVANLVMVGLGPGGGLSLYQFGGTTHVVADVVGYVSGERSGSRALAGGGTRPGAAYCAPEAVEYPARGVGLSGRDSFTCVELLVCRNPAHIPRCPHTRA